MHSLVDAYDGVFSDPQVHLTGAIELSAHITGIQTGFPGSEVVNTSIPLVHHDAAYFTWSLVDAEGAALLRGFDVMHATERDRIARVTAFYLP